MFSKMKSFLNKVKKRNEQARQLENEENDSLVKMIKQIKLFFTTISLMAPIAGGALIVMLSLLMLAGPVMMLSQFINGVADGIKDMGASLGNLFTSGCYGTDEECYDHASRERERKFVERIEEVIAVYRSNEGGGMSKNHITEYHGDLVTSGSYHVTINAALLVSALNYLDETENNYFQMQQEDLACSRLLKMGLLDSDNNRCDGQGIDSKSPLQWYVQPLSEEERTTGIVDPKTTISDQIGYDFNTIWAGVTGAGTSNTDPDQCGDYNEVYKRYKEEGIGVVYDEKENIFEKFIKWVSGNSENSQLRMLAKNMVKMDLNSTCTTISTEHLDGTVTYSRSIVNTVSFYNDRDTFKNYLVQEYIPALLLENHLFYVIDKNREEYERQNGIIDTTSKEKQYLNWLDTNGILVKAKDEFMEKVETEQFKNNVEAHAERIFEMAQMYENFSPSYSGGVSCTYAPNGEGSVGNSNFAGVKVQLLTCGSTKNNQTKVGGLIDLEDYIKGVVYAEIDTSFPKEAIKVQAIAARTFALTRQQGMCPGSPDNCWLGYNANTNVITLRGCENDQVYCSPELGCVRNYPTTGDFYQGSVSGKTQWKAPLSGDRKTEFYETIDSTAGMTVVDANGNNIITDYKNNDQNRWKRLANSGMDFNEILMNEYADANTIAGGCYFGEALEWKQCGEPWSNVGMGGSGANICRIGCLVTSVAIQIARSGTTLTVDAFDPGVFVETLNRNGGFVSGGNFTWSGWSSIAPNFTYDGVQYLYPDNMLDLAEQLSGYLNQGYYPVIEVKKPNGQHWVAITGVDSSGNIMMADPARQDTILSTAIYPSLLREGCAVALFQAR